MKDKENKQQNDFAKLQMIDTVVWGKDQDGKTINHCKNWWVSTKKWNTQRCYPTCCRTLD